MLLGARPAGPHAGRAALCFAAQGGISIKGAVDYYLSNGIPADKLVLGLGFYGRSWTLDDAANGGLGAPASKAGKPGVCTGERAAPGGSRAG